MKKGFTLVELLIGIALSGIVFLAVNAIIISISASTIQVKQIDRLEQTKNDVSLDITNAIRWSKKVEYTNESLTVTAPDDTVNTYTVVNKKLLKNNSALSGDQVDITAFTVNDYGWSETTPLINVTFTLSDSKFPTISEQSDIMVAQRQTTLKNKL